MGTEEATTLLEEQRLPQQREIGRHIRDSHKSKTVRIALGVAAFVGIVVAFDAAVMHRQGKMIIEAAADAGEAGYSGAVGFVPTGMAGWDAMAHSWCSIRSTVATSTYCQLVDNKQNCTESFKASCDIACNSTSSGSGSGSF